MSETKQRKVRLPNFFEALLPILVMMGLMIYGLNFSGEVYKDAHMPLVISIVVACIIGCLCGHSFSDMLAGMIERLNATMEAILILCTVGLLVASFIMSGTIPALIYYGLSADAQAVPPRGCILCAIVAWPVAPPGPPPPPSASPCWASAPAWASTRHHRRHDHLRAPMWATSSPPCPTPSTWPPAVSKTRAFLTT